MSDNAIEAALTALSSIVTWDQDPRPPMCRALAAAYEADADNITHTGAYGPTIIEKWLRHRVKQLRGEL